MYADRFEKRRVDPGSMAVALAINAAVVGALIFSAPEVFKRADPPPLTTTNIPLDPPPPPEPQPKPQHQTRQALPDPRPSIPDPLIPTLPGNGQILDPGPPDPGIGKIAVDPQPPQPVPVLADAQPDPRFARDFQPAYPPAARRAGQEGRITVRVLIGIDGRVKALESVSGGNEDFLNATRRQAFAHWRFRPATRDGIPYEAWKVMSVRFQIEDQ